MEIYLMVKTNGALLASILLLFKFLGLLLTVCAVILFILNNALTLDFAETRTK